ncbi:hypothetical protein ACFO5R_20785 [Halosolutus amylolyticus]|uniref:Uncharacterized protein n=1 Tax=Halosolutus amylolyticus TaxID=2932267 RepID=A0ABD5PV15_9EURY|nr:hypothetical protein [Halosolutus amylolyticus]
MLDRPDLILAAIPLLSVSGLALQSVVVAGIGTGLLTGPLSVAGYLAAFALILRELLAGPLADRSGES